MKIQYHYNLMFIMLIGVILLIAIAMVFGKTENSVDKSVEKLPNKVTTAPENPVRVEVVSDSQCLQHTDCGQFEYCFQGRCEKMQNNNKKTDLDCSIDEDCPQFECPDTSANETISQSCPEFSCIETLCVLSRTK